MVSVRKSWIAVALALLLVAAFAMVAPQPAYAAKKAGKTVAVTLYSDSATQNAKTLKAKGLKAKKAKWKSSKAKVVTVKKGKAVAKKPGKATVTAKQGKTTYKFAITVKPVSISQTSMSINVGASSPLTLEGDKIKSTTSSNQAVVAVDASGNVTGVGAGSADVTLTSKKGKNYVCKVTVVQAGAANPQPQPEPQPQPDPQPQPEPKSETVTVTSASDLNKALDQGSDLKEITFKTNDSGSITLDSQVDLSGTKLVIDAPNMTIENRAKYKEVVIDAIAPNTYIEHADNAIDVRAAKSHIRIEQEARATVQAQSAVEQMNLENNGHISELSLMTTGTVTVTGTSSQAAIKTKVEAAATIDTAVVLSIEATVKATLVLQPGSLGTTVQVPDADKIPATSGVGQATVTVVDADGKANDERTVIADYNQSVANSDAVLSRSVTGRVLDSNGAALSGVTVKIHPFGNIESTIKEASTNNEGIFTIDSVKSANYAITYELSGYRTATLNASLENSTDSKQLSDTVLFKDGEALDSTSISGNVIDATKTGNSGIEGITLRVRAGSSNVTDDILKTVTTNADGTFTVNDIVPGVYTFETVDLRNAEVHYLAASETVVVKAGANDPISLSMTPGLEAGEIRFVLRWKGADEGENIPSDLDSHLYGPRVDEGLFHTFFSQMGYYFGSNAIAELDRDDTDYIGPETTTVNELSQGTYTFFVHDYTNKESSESVAMGNSGAYVQVYSGNTLVQTYNVPSGAAGTVWAVCSYDPATKRFSAINKMMYESNPSAVGLDYLYGGLKLVDFEKNDFVTDAEIDGDRVYLNVTDTMSSDKVAKIVGAGSDGSTVSVALSDGTYVAKVTSSDKKTVRVYDLKFRVDYGDLAITNFKTNDLITGYTLYGSDEDDEEDANRISLTTKSLDFDALKDKIEPTYAKEGIQHTLTRVDDTILELKITDGTRTRVYVVELDYDWGDLKIDGFEVNDVVLAAQVYKRSIDVYVASGSTKSMWDSKLQPILPAGVTVSSKGWDEDGGVYAIAVTDGKLTRSYELDIMQDDRGGLIVGAIELNSVVTDYSIGEEYDWIGLYVIDDSESALTQNVRGICGTAGTSTKFNYSEDGDHTLVVTNSSGRSRTYDVNVSRDWQGLEVTGFEPSSIINDLYVGRSYIDLGLSTTDFEKYSKELVPIIAKSGAEYRYEYDSDGEPRLIISSDGIERSYWLEVYLDWGDLYIEGFETNDIVTAYLSMQERGARLFVAKDPKDFDSYKEAIVPRIADEDATYKVEWDEEERHPILTIEVNGQSRTYDVYLVRDWQGLEVTALKTNDVVKNYALGEGYISLELAPSVADADYDSDEALFNAYKDAVVPVIENTQATYEVVYDTTDDPDYPQPTLKISSDGVVRTYDLDLLTSYGDMNATGVVGKGGVEFSEVKMGYYRIDLVNDTLPLGDLTAENLENYLEFTFGDEVKSHRIEESYTYSDEVEFYLYLSSKENPDWDDDGCDRSYEVVITRSADYSDDYDDDYDW